MDLDLVDPAKSAALSLWRRFPFVEFTSGRRTLEQQATAMAWNVRANRRWIVQTYVASSVSAACQAWVDCHPEATLVSAVQAGLLGVMRVYANDQLVHLSKHLVGGAFDVRPFVGPEAEAVKQWLYAAAEEQGGKFLEREGGLVRWHWEMG